jgi:hypothetical protein
MYGMWPQGQIDHINGIRTDNRLSNLRDVSSAVNNHNSQRRLWGTARYVGVKETPGGRYAATICRTHLGVFDTPDQAHVAYLVAKHYYLPTEEAQ